MRPMAAEIRILALVAALTAACAAPSSGQAQIHDLTEIPPPPMTDVAIDAAFQCPEALASDDQRRGALVGYFHWAQVRHPNWSVAEAVQFREALLVRHRCTASLRDLADYSKRN
jgi:hypothetical protein